MFPINTRAFVIHFVDIVLRIDAADDLRKGWG